MVSLNHQAMPSVTSKPSPRFSAHADKPDFAQLEQASEKALRAVKFDGTVEELRQQFPQPLRAEIDKLVKQVQWTGHSGDWNFYQLTTPQPLGCWTLSAVEKLLGWNSVMDRVQREEAKPQPDGTFLTKWSKSYWYGD